jgi:hypothetical protein
MKIHLTNSAVILSEAKDLSLIYGDRMIKDGKPGLADFVRCVAGSRCPS